MSKLKAIKPDDVAIPKPKILVFGKPGTGKTWASLDFPAPYYNDAEGGGRLPAYTRKLKASGGAYFGVNEGANDFKENLEQVKALGTEKHGFKTYIADSFTKMYNTEIAIEQERLGEKDAFGASKKPATKCSRSLVLWLDRIDMNVILLAHEKDKWGKVNGQQEVIGQTFDGWEKLEYELDLVLNTFKQGKSYKARVVKSRLDQFTVGDVFDWNYETFANIYGKEILEGEVKQIELATQDQVKEINELLEKVKIDDNIVNGWLKKAKCEDFDEMDKDKAQATINYIKKEYLK